MYGRYVGKYVGKYIHVNRTMLQICREYLGDIWDIGNIWDKNWLVVWKNCIFPETLGNNIIIPTDAFILFNHFFFFNHQPIFHQHELDFLRGKKLVEVAQIGI